MSEYKNIPEEPKPWDQDLEDNISIISDDEPEEYDLNTESEHSELELEYPPPVRKFNLKRTKTQFREILQEDLFFFPEDNITNGVLKCELTNEFY